MSDRLSRATRRELLLGGAGLVALLAAGLAATDCEWVPWWCRGGPRHDASPVRPTRTPSVLPQDPEALRAVLLGEIGELLEKVPCSCCSYSVAACYRGACPLSCEPCNAIGRDVYAWHNEGASDEAIVARVSKTHPRGSKPSHGRL